MRVKIIDCPDGQMLTICVLGAVPPNKAVPAISNHALAWLNVCTGVGKAQHRQQQQQRGMSSCKACDTGGVATLTYACTVQQGIAIMARLDHLLQ
jgi:hypothetical protein